MDRPVIWPTTVCKLYLFAETKKITGLQDVIFRQTALNTLQYMYLCFCTVVTDDPLIYSHTP